MTENWSEERARLLKLIAGIEAGDVTHIDEDASQELKPAGPENISAVRARLAELDSRLGRDES